MKKTLLLGALSALLSTFTLSSYANQASSRRPRAMADMSAGQAPAYGQEKRICPEIGKFVSALTKHQQILVKEMLKTSGLLDATGLSKQDQEDLVIEYNEHQHSSSARQPITFDNTINIKTEAPELSIGDQEARDLKKVFSQQQLEQWFIKYGASLAHELSHITHKDTLTGMNRGSALAEAFHSFPLDSKHISISVPYPLFFHTSFKAWAQDLVSAPSNIKQDQKHNIAAQPLPALQDFFLNQSPEEAHHLKALHAAASSYAGMYKTTLLMEEFWKKSQATYHTNHPKTCLNKLTNELWKVVQQVTWISQFKELRADKNAIEAILKLQFSPSIKNEMLQSRFNDFYETRRSMKHDIPVNIVCTHPPMMLRENMLEVGGMMIENGQTPQLKELLNKLAIPSYLQIPKESIRTPVEQP